jgi:hypothetical protein
VTLHRTDAPGGIVSLTRFDGSVFADPCDDVSQASIDAGPEALIGLLADDPYLTAGEPIQVPVAGLEATQLDVAALVADGCPLDFYLLWAIADIEGGGEFVLAPAEQARFIVMDAGGTTLVVAIEAFPGVVYPDFLDEAMALVETLTVELPRGGSPSPKPGGTASPEPVGSASPEPGRSPAPDAGSSTAAG